MKSSTGSWVSGDNFFGRTDELAQLEAKVRDGNHILLTGQRRMGKTSIARELGARLKRDGWNLIFANTEGARDEGDAISSIASAAYSLTTIRSRLSRWLGEQAGKIEEVGAHDFRVKVRATVTEGTWRRQGHELVNLCADHSTPVLLVVDELPIFLARLLGRDGGRERVDVFLSWLREAFQRVEGRSPVLLVSGSIGLVPLVQRLRIPDRVNYLYEWRLGPWSRETSIECLQRLASAYDLTMEHGAAEAVYYRLGIGVPQHVQLFFARLQDSTAVRESGRITTEDVAEVYRTEMLGPAGQSDLLHYDTRLHEALGDDRSHEIAGVILAEAATQKIFSAGARRALEDLYSDRVEGAGARIGYVLGILVHDGYLEQQSDGYRFLSNWLKDWWSARSRGHYVPLEDRQVSRPGNARGRRIGNR